MAKPEKAKPPIPTLTPAPSRTQNFLRRQLWIWPLMAAAMLAFVGVWLRAQMEGAMGTAIAGNLNTIRDANAEALREWAATMKSQAELLAGRRARARSHRRSVAACPASRARQQAVLAGSPEFAALRKHLKPAEEGRGFSGYAVLDTNLVVLAAGREEFAGAKSPPEYAEQLAHLFRGQCHCDAPVRCARDAAGRDRNAAPAPGRDVRRRAHPLGRGAGHRGAGIAYPAGKGFHAYPGHGAVRRERGNLRVQPRRGCSSPRAGSTTS